jgi:hypothetical protein
MSWEQKLIMLFKTQFSVLFYTVRAALVRNWTSNKCQPMTKQRLLTSRESIYTLCMLSKPKLYSWAKINTALSQSACICNHSITLHVRAVNYVSTLNIAKCNNYYSTTKVCYMAPSHTTIVHYYYHFPN